MTQVGKHQIEEITTSYRNSSWTWD